MVVVVVGVAAFCLISERWIWFSAMIEAAKTTTAWVAEALEIVAMGLRVERARDREREV